MLSRLVLVSTIVALLSAEILAAASQNPADAIQEYAALPLSFERHSALQYTARGEGYEVALRSHSARLMLRGSKPVTMEFVDGHDVPATPGPELPGKVNYIHGNDPRQWRLGLPTYGRIEYKNVYPGIDLLYYGNQRQLEFDVALQPGAGLNLVRMRFKGGGKPCVDEQGNLVIGDLRLKPPVVTQDEKRIAAAYKVLPNSDVQFNLSDYDRRRPLLIDPAIVYSTVLGGSGQAFGNAIALDASGNVCIAGYTGDVDFPVINPAFAGSTGGGDGFIAKMNSTGSALIYSTYIGGSSLDLLRGIACDSTGAVWAVGETASTDFPVLNPVQAALSGGHDAVVMRLSPSGVLTFSTHLAGNGAYASSVAVDESGNAYVTGTTTTLQTTPGAFQPFNQGSNDAFVTKFNSSGGLVYSTYVGGGGYEAASAIAVDSSGSAYVTGYTYSPSFTGAPGGGAQPSNGGEGDAFIAKLNLSGSALTYFTFLGGLDFEFAEAIAVNPTGNAYVAGITASTNLPVTTGASQTANAGGYDGFVAKLNSAGTAFVYVTYLGGERRDEIRGLAYDTSSGGVYVTGQTDSALFPVVSPVQPSLGINSASLFRTTNSGGAWSAFDAAITGAASFLAADPITPGVLVVSTETGILRTANNGASWTLQLRLSSNVGAFLSRSQTNSNYLYAMLAGSVYLSTDGGVTWAYRGYAGSTYRVVADPLTSTNIYALDENSGVSASSNAGATWNPVNSGLPTQNFYDLAIASDGTLYVAVQYYGIYKSTNHGGSWSPVNTGLPSLPSLSYPGTSSAQALTVSPSNPSVLYVVVNGSVYKTTNGGASWAPTSGSVPSSPQFVAVSPQDPSTVYATSAVAPVVYRSTDGGATWNPAASGLGAASIQGFAFDLLDSSRVFVFATVPQSAFVAKINSSGSGLLYSTYLGNSVSASAYAIATNGAGDVFVTGGEGGANFPLTVGSPPPSRSAGAFITRISDATATCSYAVSPASQLISSPGQTITYNVIAPSGCPWTAMSSQTWAAIAAGTSGSGSGFFAVAATSNTTGSERSTTITAAGQSLTIRQVPTSCVYFVSSNVQYVPAAGGAVQLNMNAGTGCDWTVVNDNPNAIVVAAGGSGAGNGVVRLNVAPNLGSQSRNLFVESPEVPGFVFIVQNGASAPGVTHFEVTAPTAVVAGVPIQFAITALDPSNNPVNTYSEVVHFSSTDSSAALPKDTALVNGIGTFTASLVKLGAQTIMVSDAFASSINGTSGIITVSAPSGLRFVPVTPCRVVDTRNPTGTFGGPLISAGTSRDFTIPSGACGIPTTAQAYSFNVAVVPSGPLGFVTVWPTGQTRPLAATLNSLDGRIKSNAAIVPAGASGSVSVYATNDTNLILDINGYFVAAATSGSLAFYPVTPCRLVDTRNGTLISGQLVGGASRTLPLLSSSCNVPATAQAYSLNLVVVPPGPVGFLTAYPTGTLRPGVATLNDLTGTIVANAAIVPAGTNGSIDVYASNTTDLVVDINGYFAPPATGGLSLYALTLCRALDTRQPAGALPFSGQIDVNVLGSGCGGTPSAQAYVFNATVVPPGPLGFLTLWPQGTTRPTVATLNALDGAITNNMAVVPTNNTLISAYANNPTQLILDMSGYFAP